MNIKRFTPSPSLSPFIREFLLISSSQQTINTLIPDTHIVLSFRYRGEVRQNASVIPHSVISGLRRTPRHIEYGADSANILVIFKEAGLTALSGTPSHHLYGQLVGSEDLFGKSAISETLDWLTGTSDDHKKIQITENFLLKALQKRSIENDGLIAAAIQTIRQQEGIIRIRDLAASMHISQDAFEKRFRMAVGSSPKQYASIVRLRQLIGKYTSSSSLTDASYEAGYFDQSHFIRDFRVFTGQSPKAFFQSARYW